MKELWLKIKEALISSLPITAIVYILALTPLFEFTAAEFITFTIGAVLLILGIGLFNLGADIAMTPIGTHVGSGLAKQRRLGLLLVVCFVLGMLITIAELDLQVLAKQVSAVMNGTVLIYAVSIGVGASITLSVVRVIYDFSLVYYIIPGYFISLALSLFVPPIYTAIAFDSGGVASGPMTSGFILPFITGVCVCQQGEGAVLRDAFGVVALVAMTPLITIQLLGFRSIMDSRMKERRAMRKILDADDQQIISFM